MSKNIPEYMKAELRNEGLTEDDLLNDTATQENVDATETKEAEAKTENFAAPADKTAEVAVEEPFVIPEEKKEEKEPNHSDDSRREIESLKRDNGRMRKALEEERGKIAKYEEMFAELEAASQSRGGNSQEVEQSDYEAADPRYEQLDAKISAADKKLADMEKTSFHFRLKAAVPELDRIVNHSKWQQFLNLEDSDQGYSYRDSLTAATTRLDDQRSIRVFTHFKKWANAQSATQGAPPVTAQSKLAAIATPNKLASNSAPSSQFLFKESDLDVWNEQKRRGTITQRQFQEKMAAFQEAELRGQVQLDV